MAKMLGAERWGECRGTIYGQGELSCAGQSLHSWPSSAVRRRCVRAGDGATDLFAVARRHQLRRVRRQSRHGQRPGGPVAPGHRHPRQQYGERPRPRARVRSVRTPGADHRRVAVRERGRHGERGRECARGTALGACRRAGQAVRPAARRQGADAQGVRAGASRHGHRREHRRDRRRPGRTILSTSSTWARTAGPRDSKAASRFREAAGCSKARAVWGCSGTTISIRASATRASSPSRVSRAT